MTPKLKTMPKPRFAAAALGAAAFALLAAPGARAQIDGTNWGAVTAPVYNTSETAAGGGLYSRAELLAGPNKAAELTPPFASPNPYFTGVLPNGKKVTPAGVVAQIGMHPLGSALTPDGQYIVLSCDDERNISGGVSTQPSATTANGTTSLTGGYTVTVLRTSDLKVAAQAVVGRLFVGLQVVPNGAGAFTIYASGGADHNVKVLTFTPPATPAAAGTITAQTPIPIAPISPNGTPTNFVASSTALSFNGGDFPENGGNTGPGNPVGAGRLSFPAGSALSPDGKYLYVACNGDNSLAVIRTATNSVIRQIPVGFLPYGVSVSRDGTKVLVSNWGVQPYSFLAPPTLDATGAVTALNGAVTPGQNVGGLFFVPQTSIGGTNPKTSSVSVISVPGGNAAQASLLGSVYQGQPAGLDDRYTVGETHPSATAIVRRGALEVQYVAKAGSDALGLMLVANNRRLPDLDLSPLNLNLAAHVVHGTYPNALAVSPDNTRVYVAEAGLNSVAVLDTTSPTQPRLLGRIPTGWYPSALSVSADGGTLYIVNDKGVGEDLNPLTDFSGSPTPSGVESFSNSNSIFGTLQKVNLATQPLDNTTALGNNFAVQSASSLDASVVPLGGPASAKIKHVFFILHENKTFDSVLGNQTHFGPFAGTNFNAANGATMADATVGPTGYTALTLNTQALADTFAAGVNYYSDAEESDAGHQFSASGTASDYTEKTLLVKSGRGLLANKNFEPEDYPEGGYIFNNAARGGVSFKDYGALLRVSGTDNGFSTPARTIDPLSGLAGVPVSPESNPVLNGLNTTNVPPAGAAPTQAAGSDVTTQTVGLGQSYFLRNPILAILGQNNANGEPHLDRNYPGYNFGISDQRRAQEFNQDFDRMVKAGTLPQFIYLYQPNDHTGPSATTNVTLNGSTATGAELIADGDTALGLVVKHIMASPAYYSDPSRGGDGTGSAIFMTYDDAQSGQDHLDPHRTPLLVISPYAKPGFVGTRHYSTASIVKTEELLLGMPPNNYGDLFATDLRDLFQSAYNGIHLSADGLSLLGPNQQALVRLHAKSTYVATAEGRHVWTLARRLDTSGPDRDSYRLSVVTLLSMRADALRHAAEKKHALHTATYRAAQAGLFQAALKVVRGPRVGDADGD